MITLTYESREDWLAARRGKITGSRLKDILVKRGNGKKIGFYELIAERIALEADGEDPMDRGTRLEAEAMDLYKKQTGADVNTDLVIWAREDNENIAVSPDGFIGKEKAVEVKCLSSARHVEAYVTKSVPSEYEDQVLQYFVVNDELIDLDLVFYDPRIPSIPFFVITTKRENVQEQVEFYLDYERMVLAEVNQIVGELTF